MAAPNLLTSTTVTGLTAVAAVTTTLTSIVTNAGSSGKAHRINAVYVSNINGSSAATVTIVILRSATAYRIAYNMSVPAASSLDLISKAIYLNEGDELQISASVNSYLEAVVSYEEIS